MLPNRRNGLLRSHVKEDTIPKPVGLGSLSSSVKRCQVRVKRCQENHAHRQH